MKKSILMVLMFMLSVVLLTAGASYANGTAAGTTITNQVFLSAANAANTSAVIADDTQVAAIYGETTTAATAGTQHANSVLLGETATIIYEVKNTGNTSDSFYVEIGNLQYLGGAAEWTHSIVDKDGVEQGQTFIIGPIAEEGSETFAVRISANTSLDSAPNNSQAYCTVAVYAYGKTLTVTYTGDNGTVYADSNSHLVWTDSAMVSAAVFTLTKVCTGTTLAGAPSLPVPGATLWYEITYENIGSADGTNVYIYDQIDSASTTFSDTVGSDPTWTVYYATTDAPTPVFGGNGEWTAGLPADRTTVRWIKWDKATVVSTETNSLRYTVIIK